MTRIAIIGMALEFPGAHNPEEYWQNILAGRRAFRLAPDERMPRDVYYDPDPGAREKTYQPQMAVLEGWRFDPSAYRIPPVTVEASDITHWLALDVAARAIADAGLDLQSADRERIGVILGNTLTGEVSRANGLKLRTPHVRRAARRALAGAFEGEALEAAVEAVAHQFSGPMPEIAEDALSGNMSNTIAGRISGYFDLGGCSYVVDGACSSALLAVVHAVRFLRSGDLDVAVVGGVDISQDPLEIVGFAKAGALARTDIRPYDRRADGMITGEGCGVFILAREDFARQNGLRARAYICGAAISSDGAGGITEPIKEGQKRALRRAYDQAGYPMSSIGLVEGHGTGTPLGDRVELAAIQEVLEEAGEGPRVALGGVKANIGHCKAAAGAAGLAKTILALERGIKPPHVNAPLPNPAFSGPAARIYPCLEGEAWQTEPGVPRRAGISSMGFGGANSHVTLEAGDAAGGPAPQDLDCLTSAQASEVVFLSAPDPGALREEALRLAGIAERLSRAELTDLASACAQRPETGDWRAAMVARSPWELAAQLREVAHRLDADGDSAALSLSQERIFLGRADRSPQIAAMFPGQGSHALDMGRALFRRRPATRELYARADARLEAEGLRAISPLMHRATHKASAAQAEAWEAELRQTEQAQPAIALASLAMLEALEDWGIAPALAFGHSLGELSALCCAGAISPEETVLLAALRGCAMARADGSDTGAMLALFAPLATTQALMARVADPSLCIANYNAADQNIVSGTTAAVTALQRQCEDANVACRLLRVSHAFHSDLVAPAAGRFREDLARVTFQPRSRRVISASLAEEIAADADLAELLAGQIRKPVLFRQTLSRVAEAKPDLLLEIGPGRVLAGLALRSGLFPAGAVLTTNDDPEDPWIELLTVAAAAYALGAPVRRDRLFAGRFARPIRLDAYAPVFIRNPCEAPVPALASMPVVPAMASLLPEGTSAQAGADYLRRRGAFIRALIAADFQLTAQPTDEPAGAPAEPAPPGPGPAAAGGDLVLEARRWVAARTGYALEDIDPEANLRTSLNLDSIKTGELMAYLGTLVGREGFNPDQLMTPSIVSIVASVSATAESAEQTTFARRVQRWEGLFRRVDVPAGIAATLPPPAQILVVYDTSDTVSAGCAASLQNACPGVAAGGIEAFLADPAAARGCDAFVLLLPATSDTPLDVDRLEQFAALLFRVFRALQRARGQDTDLRILCVRSASCSGDGAGGRADLDAGAAFLKTFQLETGCTFSRWLALDGVSDPATCILEELCQSGEVGPVRRRADGTRTVQRLAPAGPGKGSPLGIGPEDVVIVSGGAKGITAELALELARRTRARFVLFGASPPPSTEEDPVALTLRRFSDLGTECIYRQCDITDPDAVKALIASVEAGMGPVTGILHGAGVTEFASLREKTLQSFFRCIDVKDLGLIHILSAVDPARLKLVHAISSVLGHTGMRLQTDYTFANAWLDEALAWYRKTHPHTDCMTIGYTVWRETGMGVKVGALDGLEQLGVDPVTIAEGVRAYSQALDCERSGETAFVHTGALTADLERNIYGPPPAHDFRFLDRILRWSPGFELLAESTLSVATDPFLADHVFEGTPLLPGVMGLEAMMEAASLLGADPVRDVLKAVAFLRPVIVPASGRAHVRAAATRRPDGRSFDVALYQSADGFAQPCFTAQVRGGSFAPVSDPDLATGALPAPLPIDVASLHPDPLFQGALFRNIEAVYVREPGRRAVTRVRVPESPAYFDRSGPQIATPSPATQDSFLQTGGLIAPLGLLPTRIGQIAWSRDLISGEALTCEVIARPGGQRGRLSADIRVFDAAGDLVGLYTQVELSAVDGGAARAPEAGAVTERLALAGQALAIASGADPATRRLEAFRSALRRSGVPGTTRDAVLANAADGRPVATGRDLAVSLSHSGSYTVALVAAGGPVGIDLERVRSRAASVWRALLGTAGFQSAEQLARALGRSLDAGATLVWSAFEALGKSGVPGRWPSGLQRFEVRDGVVEARVETGAGDRALRLGLARIAEEEFAMAVCQGNCP